MIKIDLDSVSLSVSYSDNDCYLEFYTNIGQEVYKIGNYKCSVQIRIICFSRLCLMVGEWKLNMHNYCYCPHQLKADSIFSTPWFQCVSFHYWQKLSILFPHSSSE